MNIIFIEPSFPNNPARICPRLACHRGEYLWIG